MKVEIVKGIGGIRYVKIIERSRLLDPRQNFSLKEYTIERRRDPITGRWCRINVERALRERRIEQREVEECISKIFDETRMGCVFCKENVEKSTPKFHDGTRIVHGKVMLMPNLYPFAETHAIGVIDPEKHEIDVGDLCNYFEDILRACIEYFKKLGIEYRYHYVNMNFLFPAGSSIPHAHIQVFSTRYPSVYHYEVLRRCMRYYEKYNRNLMVDYANSEIVIGDRLIRSIDNLIIFAAYAPRGYNEVHIVHTDIHDIVSAKDQDISNIVKAMCTVLRGFRYILDQRSFNFSIFSTNSIKYGKYSRILIRLVTRKEPVPYYTNDIGFIELLHEEPVIITYPENVAEKLRNV